MISNFSPLLEVFAAIYITIAFDDILLKRFWSPDFYYIINKSLIDLNIPDMIIDKIKIGLSGVARKEDMLSRRRGRFLLIILIILFIIIAYETQLTRTDIFNLSFSLYMSLTLLVVFLDSCFLKSLCRMVLSIVFVCLSFILVYNYCPDLPEKYCRNLEIIMPILLLITIIGPVMWQLIRNYLFTTVYREYLRNKLVEEIARYDTACKVDKERGGDINTVHEDYRNILYENAKNHNDTIDNLLSELLNVLSDKLSIVIKIPPLYKIFWYWLKNVNRVDEHEFGSEDIKELSEISIEPKYIEQKPTINSSQRRISKKKNNKNK